MARPEEVAEKIGARIVTSPLAARGADIRRFYAGDRMSELLNEASDSTLLVTHLENLHLLRVAALLDVPALCLLDGCEPDAELTEAARDHGKCLMVSKTDMATTCRLLAAVPLAGSIKGRSA